METSIFKQFNKVVAHKTLQQIIFEIKNGEVQNEINSLRKLIAEGNTKAYDEQKKIIVGIHTIRQI
jgi:hypothetical protein